MPFNGSGTASPPNPPTFPAVSGQTIEAAKFNAVINDIYACLTQVITKDGQTVITGTLQWADEAANLLALGGVSSTATQTINGVKTFAASPKSLAAAVDATDLLRKGEFDAAVASLTSGKAPAAGNAAQTFAVATSSNFAHAVRRGEFTYSEGVDAWKTTRPDGVIELGARFASTIDAEETFTWPFSGFPVTCWDVQLMREAANATTILCISAYDKTGFKVDRENGLDGTHYFRVRAIGR